MKESGFYNGELRFSMKRGEVDLFVCDILFWWKCANALSCSSSFGVSMLFAVCHGLICVAFSLSLVLE